MKLINNVKRLLVTLFIPRSTAKRIRLKELVETMYEKQCAMQTSARPEVRGTADVGWRSLNPLPINPPRTHSRLYHHMFFRTDGR